VRLVDEVDAAATVGGNSDFAEAVLRWRRGLFTDGHADSDVGDVCTWAGWTGFRGSG